MPLIKSNAFRDTCLLWQRGNKAATFHFKHSHSSGKQDLKPGSIKKGNIRQPASEEFTQLFGFVIKSSQYSAYVHKTKNAQFVAFHCHTNQRMVVK